MAFRQSRVYVSINKKTFNIHSIGCHITPHSKMSLVLFKLAKDATVHGIRSPCGTYFFSTYDFINSVCQRSGKYAYSVWDSVLAEDAMLNEKRKLVHSTKSNVNYQLDPIKKRRPTPVMTLMGLRALVEALGTRAKADPSRRFEDIYARFMTGDTSVVEVRKHPFFAAAVDKAPAPAAAPAVAPAQEPEVEGVGAKRMRDQEEVLFNLELQERQLTIQERQVSVQERLLTLREKALALQK